MSETAGAEVQSQNIYKGLAALIISTFFVGVSFGLGYPLVALTLAASGEESWVLGLAGAAPSLAILILLPFLPRVIRRIGTVPAMMIGSTGTAAGFLALYLFPGAGAWIAIRFFMGSCIALTWLISQIWITVATPSAVRGRVMALYVIAFSGGMAICPTVIEQAGITGILPFMISAGFALLTAVPILFVTRQAPKFSTQAHGGMMAMLSVVPVPIACGFLSGAIEMICISLLAKVAFAGGLDAAAALNLLSAFLVGAMALQFLVGWLTDRMSPITISIAISVACGGAALLIPAVISQYVPMAVIMFLLGGVAYGLYTTALAILGDPADLPEHGAANAAIIMSYQAGGVIGPMVCGAAMTYAPIAGFVGSLSVMSFLLAAIMAATARR